MKIKNWKTKATSYFMAIVMMISLFQFVPMNIQITAAAPEIITCKPLIGVNIESLADWSAGAMFVDMMKTSRKWGSVNAPWDEKALQGADGWPLEDAGICLFTNTKKTDDTYRDVSGTYKLSFEGTATIPNLFGSFTVSNQIVTNGVTTADVNLLPGVTSVIMTFKNTTCNSSTGKGVKNVRLIRPGYVPDVNGNYQTFTNEFLSVLEPFSTLRLMEMFSTNNQDGGSFVENEKTLYFSKTLKTWEDRRRPTDSTQASTVRGFGGMAWEYAVELANLSKKDIWINIPSNATDDFITNVAQLLLSTLDSEINVYVEYSNEVWNWQFSQAQSNVYYANNDPKLTKYGAGAYVVRYAERSAHMAQLFESVFGTEAMNQRIRCVLAWQSGNGSSFDFMLNGLKDTYPELGNPNDLFYALSEAPYFMEPLPADCTSVAAIHANMIKTSNSKRYDKLDLVATAKKWNMSGGVLAYEGGPHHQGQVDVNLSIRRAAHRDVNMKDILLNDIKNNWWDLGAKGFMYFGLSSAYGIYGCWGAVESFDNLNGPKYQALLQLSQTPLADINIYSPPGGLIRNEGFEEDFLKWSFSGTNSVYSIETSSVKTGTKALKLTGATSWQAILQNVTWMKQNTNYTLSFYTKGNAGGISVNYTDNGWKEIKKMNTGVNEDWTLKTISFNSGQHAGYFIKIQDASNGIIYFDDFRLFEDAPLNITPTPTSNATPTPIPSPTLDPTSAVTATPTLSPTPTLTPPPTPIAVTGISISKTSATLKVPLTLQLTASVLPSNATNKKITWISSNVNIATVSTTGKVTVKQPGNANITATSADGSFRQVCRVTVIQPVKGVSLSRTLLSIPKGKTAKLIASITPSNASNKKITWNSSNKKIATVTSTGVVKGLKKGFAYIYIYTVDGNKSARCKVTIK